MHRFHLLVRSANMSDGDGKPPFCGGSLGERCSSESEDEAEDEVEEVQDEAWRSGSQASSLQETPPESGRKTLR